MRIAFISFEFPPDTAEGGLATYVWEASRMLAARRHCVHVIAASRTREVDEVLDGVRVSRRRCSNYEEFTGSAAGCFIQLHRREPFDLLEGADWQANYADARRLAPDVPLVVKLHTPSYLLRVLNSPVWYDKGVRARLRQIALRRFGLLGLRLGRPVDSEGRAALEADIVSAPSAVIGTRVAKDWGIPESRLSRLALPFSGGRGRAAPPGSRSGIVFVGRLELRKGVLDLAKAIGLLAARGLRPKVTFVGAEQAAPNGLGDIRGYLRRLMGNAGQDAVFTGPVGRGEVVRLLRQHQIAVFPSIWESFGYVCLEAMAAGCVVIGTRGTGLAELLEHGHAGAVVPPLDARAVADAIFDLLNDPNRRRRLSERARVRALEEFSWPRIAPLQEREYERAVALRRAAGC